jgi:proteasome lid subunit RPN8/RPN11
MDIVLTSGVLTALIAAARDKHPCEACGILLGANDRIIATIPAANVHITPETHFEIDPQALIDAHRAARAQGALQVIGYYHSHPNGEPVPSNTDQAAAARNGGIWAIIAGRDVRLWRDGPQGFESVSYTTNPA